MLTERTWRVGLAVFLVVMLGHSLEHIVQAVQIWVLGWPVPDSKGLIGLMAPALVTSEWLHWVYNVLIFAGLFILGPGLDGRARKWWTAALVVQGWHFIEHGLLLAQAQMGVNLFGGDAPRSLIQLVVPRVELHLFYNAIVTILALVGLGSIRRKSVAQAGGTRGLLAPSETR